VHSGFYDTWTFVKPQVTAALQSAVAQYPSYQIIATGHSLGGSVATIAVGDLRQAGYIIDLVSCAPAFPKG
jgi:alpha-beta hydrolase superfamily lysophospholipase